MEQNWITFTPYGLIKNLWQIHPRDSHVEFMGKNKVSYSTWAKLRGLIVQEKIAKTSKKSSEKNLLKPLKITIFKPNLCKTGGPMGHAQNIFFFKNKSRS